MIFVNEIFEAIQGEGPTIGMPVIFLRLSGCNLTCSWCDSKYTWHNDYLEKSTKYTNTQLVTALSKYKSRRIVITGGEPMLQARQFGDLFKFLHPPFTVEFETNGTIYNEILEHSMVASINCSPKLKSSGVSESRYNYPVLKKINDLKTSCFKFVAKDINDINEIHNQFHFIEREKIYLMPEGQTRAEVIKSSRWVIKQCIKNRWKLSPRAHILLYSNKRGV